MMKSGSLSVVEPKVRGSAEKDKQMNSLAAKVVVRKGDEVLGSVPHGQVEKTFEEAWVVRNKSKRILRD